MPEKFLAWFDGLSTEGVTTVQIVKLSKEKSVCVYEL